jgi:MFS family permease
MGVVSMGWVPRIPEIKEAIGLTNSQLGLVFIGSTIGAVLGAQFAGRAIHTFGTKKVVSGAVLVMPVGLIAMGSATTFTQLFLALFMMGFGYANLDITSNTVAVEVENLVDRKWMVSFHGCWSLGAFATTVLGGSIAHAERHERISSALESLQLFSLFHSLATCCHQSLITIKATIKIHQRRFHSSQKRRHRFGGWDLECWAV